MSGRSETTGDRLSRIETQVRFVYDRSPDGSGLVLPNRDVLALVEVAKAARDYVEQKGWHPDLWHQLRAALARLDGGAAEEDA